MRPLKSAIVMTVLCITAACGRGEVVTPPVAQARIILNTESPRPTIDVVEVPPDQLGRIYGTDTPEAWTAILKVSAGAELPAVGQYAIEGERIRFTPMFPLDHGRQYHVTFTPPGGSPVTATVGLPALDVTPTTIVSQVYPTGDTVPENQLRFHIEFSSPMKRRGGADLVHLLDQGGKDLADAFLPLEPDFWNEERTRYTAYLDPLKRSLIAGNSYTLVVDAASPDARGLPLKQAFKRTFTAIAADDQPIDPKTWKIETPMTGTTDPLIVTFDRPLDQGLLQRAVSVVSINGKAVDGEAIIGPGEMTWEFTPDQPWKAGGYNLSVLGMLEDRAGNRIGHRFSFEQFDRSVPAPAEKTLIPVSVR